MQRPSMKTLAHIVMFTMLLPGLVEFVNATPMWTYEQAEAERLAREQYQDDDLRWPRERRSLDDPPPYFLHYRMLCDFLDGMQYTGAGVNRGGMIEGESGGDQNIIETDNTQEAIRDWSQFAVWTGDTATYHQNIIRAWEYCWRFPAWLEGGGGFSYYSAHNCGWGFEAVWKYREAYGDTSQNRYADSCAAWMVTHPLNWGDILNAYSEALGLGGMYAHAVYRNRQDWVNHCINRGSALRAWLQQNPTRMSSETWALCGGTAVWGLTETLFRAYPDSGAIFFGAYGQNLQVWESFGQWNHSFNAWYANAHHRAFELTQDSAYWNNAVYICDSLIGLDTDSDGGIYPGRTAYSPANDHSWVSAYMGWMGMERIINGLPSTDAAVVAIVTPNPQLPHPAGIPFPFSVRIANAAISPVAAQITAELGTCQWATNIALDYGQDTVLVFAPQCLPPDDNSLPDSTLATVIVTAEGDDSRANDTLRAYLDIRRRVGAFGRVVNAGDGTGIANAGIEFRHEAYADSVWYMTLTDAIGDYSTGATSLMAGSTAAIVTPTIQNMVTVDTIHVDAGNSPLQHNIVLAQTMCAVIDDDVDQTYESYYLSALNPLGLQVRLWDRSAAATGSLVGIPVVIWYTGNDSVTTLLPWDEDALSEYLESGGQLLLSGQNITEDLAEESDFLTAVLACSVRTHDTNIRTTDGVSGHALTDSMRLVLQGTQGANNQNSTSSLWPVEETEPIFVYASADSQVAGVAGQHGEGTYVFLGFGLEAVSGASSSTTRAQFFARLFEWFDLPESSDPYVPVPFTVSLAANYPNPFNPGTVITFVTPYDQQAVLSIYNVLGQRVRTLFEGRASGITQVFWDGTDFAGNSAATGMYVYRLTAGKQSQSRTMQLIR